MTDGIIKLSVSGMSCEHCRCRVERALLELPDVQSAAVDLATGAVTVTVDADALSTEKLIAAIEAVGYEAAAAE